MTEYYVIRNKSTGMYFRGKGANRWGEYHNQASVYRIKAHAENTFRWLSLRGESVEIVPIRIIENATDVVPVVRCKDCKNRDEITKECKHPKAVGWDVIIPEDNDFCSYGERKEENEGHS